MANWQGGDVRIPKNQWTAVTGPSGSGKTSLLFGALEAWSSRQFELLNNPAAVVSRFNNHNIATDIHGLTPVLASAGEIPRQRRNTLLIDMLHLHPLLQQWWKQQGSYRCAQCAHAWRPFSVDAVIADLEIRVNDSAALVLSHTSSELGVDELLMQGLTRYYQDGALQRIEDIGQTLKAGSWLLHDRFKGMDGNQERAREALNAAHARSSRIAVVIAGDLVEYQVDSFCHGCHAPHDVSDLSLQYIDGSSLSELLSAPLSRWGELLDSEDQCAAACLVRYALDCGLQHLQVQRSLATLSLGEARRIELLSWISQARTGQTLVFDEPGIGLHGHERLKVAALFRKLVASGNTVITADPCYEFLAAADSCLIVGPGSGKDGGTVCGSGSLQQLEITPPHGFAASVELSGKEIVFDDLQARHLDISRLAIPLGCVVAICGISGSGKSTLFAEELWPRLKELQKTHPHLTRGSVHSLLQRSLSTAARSTLATLAGCMSELRELFAATPRAKQRGFVASDFVASPKRGACIKCKGLAIDSYSAVCSGCSGLALRDELLEFRYRGASLKEWLSLPLIELTTLLPRKGKLRKCVELLIKLGLGSRRLGERAQVFSFGERSRIALARRLSLIKVGTPKLFLIDEACLGLPDDEANNFMCVLSEFCAEGHSFWLIEHHHVVLRNAAHLIEIGPGAAEHGGKVVYQGPPSGLQQCSTATAEWLTSTVTPRPQSDNSERFPPRFEWLSDGLDRGGYQKIRAELSTELRMRSVLSHNQFADDLSNESARHPVAWPVGVASRTPLLKSLGLDDYVSEMLVTHGQLCCSACGGAGPFSSLSEFVHQLDSGGILRFACEMPQSIEQHPQRETWLAAAGYRTLIDSKYIELDSFALQVIGDELDERCSDVIQQMKKLQQYKLLVFEGPKLLSAVQMNACRDCQQVAPLEYRLQNHSLVELRTAEIDDVLRLLVRSIPNDPILLRAIELLEPTSLFHISADRTVQSLTSVERRSSRIIGILLFAPKDLCLLFDNVFAGFPSTLGRFLAQACRDSGLPMHHVDAAGYFEKPDVASLGSALPRPQSFTSPYSFKSFSPSAASAYDSLGEALQLDVMLAEYYSRCDNARLRGIKIKDLLASSSKFKCQSCQAKRGVLIHPAFLSNCSACSGTGFDSSLSSLIERGLSFTQALRLPLFELSTALQGTKMEKVVEAAIECGLREYCLSTQIGQMPRSLRTLAPVIYEFAATASDVGVHGIFDGLDALQVRQLCSTIQGLATRRSLLEWRENHPQFNI